MTRRAGAARRSTRWFRAAASSPAPALRQSLLFTGVRIHSYGRIEKRSSCPMSKSAVTPSLKNVVIDRGVRVPEGLVVGEDPELDSQAVPPHAEGHLPHHPAHDRPASGLGRDPGSFGRFGNLPFRQDRRARGCRGALPAALPAPGVEMRSLIPGYPAVLAAAPDRETRASRSGPVWRTGAAARRARRRGLDLFVLERRISTSGRATLWRARRAGLAGQRLALCGAGPDRRRDRARHGRSGVPCPTSCTRMTGRRGSRRPTCITGRRRPARHRDDRA